MISGVRYIHQVVICRVNRRLHFVDGDLLTAQFFPRYSWMVRIFARVSSCNQCTKEPTTKEVSSLLARLAKLEVKPEVKLVGSVPERGCADRGRIRHYFSCDSREFWDSPLVSPYRVQYRICRGGGFELLGEYHDRFLGVEERQLQNLIAMSSVAQARAA